MINGIRPTRRRVDGHTLLEMMLSLVLLSIVMATVGSAVMFASQAIPDDDSAVGSMLADSAVLSRIAEDLASAQYVIEQTGSAVTVVVPDRTGDNIPDRIRYAWSGTYAGPLTYQLNDEDAINLIDSVAVFNLEATITTSTRTIPGQSVASGSETLIDAFDTVLLTSPTTGIDPSNLAGQRFTPSFSSGASGYVPSRVEFRAKKQGGASGEMVIEVAHMPGSRLSAQVYSTGLISEGDLANSMTWYSVDLTGSAVVPADEEITLLFSASDTSSATVANLHYNLGTGGMVSSSNAAASFSESLLNTVYYRLYGYEQASGGAWDVSQQPTTMVNVSLLSTADDRSPVTRNVRMLLAPVALDAFAQTDFAVDPTTMDLNADGSADWSHSSGTFPAGSINSGVWTADGQLIFAPDGLSSAEVITIDARICSADVHGLLINGPNTIDNSGDLLPLTIELRKESNGSQRLLIYNSTTKNKEVGRVSGLPLGMIDLRLILIPKEQVLGIMINHELVGSVQLERIVGTGSVEQDVRFGTDGGVACFGSINIRVGGDYSANTDGEGLDLSDIFNLIDYWNLR